MRPNIPAKKTRFQETDGRWRPNCSFQPRARPAGLVFTPSDPSWQHLRLRGPCCPRAPPASPAWWPPLGGEGWDLPCDGSGSDQRPLLPKALLFGSRSWSQGRFIIILHEIPVRPAKSFLPLVEKPSHNPELGRHGCKAGGGSGLPAASPPPAPHPHPPRSPCES